MAVSDRKKVAGGVFWLSLERVIGFCVSFFGGIILARTLQPDDFGAVAFATATFLVLSRLCGIGINQEIVRADESAPDYNKRISTYFWLNGVIVLTFFLLMLGLIFLSGLFTGAGRYVALVIAGGWSVSNFCDPCRSLLQKGMHFRVLSFLQWLPGLFGMGGAVLFAYNGGGVWSLCVPQMVTLALAGISALLLCGFRPRFEFCSEHAKEIFAHAKWYLGNGFCEGAYQRVDDLAIGHFLGQGQLGFYDRAYMLGGMFHHNAGNVVSRIIFPLFAKRAGDTEAVARLYGITIRFVLYAAFFVLLLFSIYSPQIISALWGEKWLPAAEIFRYMAPYSIILPAFYISKDVMISLGFVKDMSKIYSMVLLTIVALIYPAIYLYGLRGAAVTVDLAIVVGLVQVGRVLKSKLATLDMLRTFVRPLGVMLSIAALTIGGHILFNWLECALYINIAAVAIICSALSLIVLCTIEREVLRFITDLVAAFFKKEDR